MRNKKLYLYILLGALILVSCQEDISAQQEDNDINKSKSCSADKDELNKYEYIFFRYGYSYGGNLPPRFD